MPADVQDFVAANVDTHARALCGALNQLQAASQAHGRPVTLALADQTLAELIRSQARAVRLPDIEAAVCNVFGLEPDSLQSGRKGKLVDHPRMLAMWLAEAHPGRLERDRPILWPPQPYHGHLGAETGQPLDGRWRSAGGLGSSMQGGRSHPPRRRSARAG